MRHGVIYPLSFHKKALLNAAIAFIFFSSMNIIHSLLSNDLFLNLINSFASVFLVRISASCSIVGMDVMSIIFISLRTELSQVMKSHINMLGPRMLYRIISKTDASTIIFHQFCRLCLLLIQLD